MANEIWIAVGSIFGAALAAYIAARRNRLDAERTTDDAVRQVNTNVDRQMAKAFGVPWAFVENLPLPCWQKDINGTMLWINNEYEQQWGIKSSMYEGRTDYDIWPNHIASRFRQHDQLVVAQRRVLLTIEMVPDKINDTEAPIREWKIWKFPIINETGDVVGVGGVAAIGVDGDGINAAPIVPTTPEQELWLTKLEDEGE